MLDIPHPDFIWRQLGAVAAHLAIALRQSVASGTSWYNTGTNGQSRTNKLTQL